MKKIEKHRYLALALGVVAAFAVAADEKPEASKPKSTAAAPHWAYQPVKRPDVPAVKQKDWVRTPIDAFVLNKIESKGLKPSPETDRATFIRRATLDTWGVIPTPEEVTAFVNDKSPNAYEKLVDRLLSSSHYGERWGRRWLDLTRYADSDGYNADGTRPNVWRYRDYVINAFNIDKPYNVFIKEQLAGDELWPDRNEALIATGFLRNYPDEINARDLNLKKQEIATDMTDTVGSVFLGATVGCAKCHNHKFDKISQKEYFQLQAFFANASARDDIPVLKDKELSSYQARLDKYNEATKDIRGKMDTILKPTIDKLEADRLLGFTPATRDSIGKAEKDRNAYDRWIYNRSLWTLTGRTRNAENRLKEKDKEGYAKYQELKEELKKFDNLKPAGAGNISAIFELGPNSPATNVLANGIYDRLLDEVQPGFPAAFTGEKPDIKPTATSSGRRTALANWITSTNNPLTARVFVNRVWNQYFTHGIVDTVSDFGKVGERPVNPELLDYLADSFVKDDQWSIKKLQRKILLSSVYRQASEDRPELANADPNNRLLATFPRQRLDAEEIRDSLLAASGLLESKIGGPAVFPPVPKGLNAGNAWTASENPHDHNRRSIYVFTRRNVAYPMFEAFDMANPNSVHSRREVTTTAPQALALVNNDLVFQWSQALAGRVIREGGSSEAARIDRLYQILYSRKPEKAEKESLLAFLDSQEAVIKKQLDKGKKVAAPEGYGVSKTTTAQVDKLFQSLYGRQADRFERAALVDFLNKQHEKLAKSKVDEEGNPLPPVQLASFAGQESPARAAAFVDLVHAAVNANEFSYRF